jgi:hypothetical protein
LSTGRWVEGGDAEFQIHPENRRGDLEQVINYCTSTSPNKRSHWGPDVWSRLLNASLAALMLQWGTAGAAIIIAWFTPTIGLGCRSGSYLVYAGASTVIWILLVISSILTHFLTSPTSRIWSVNEQWSRLRSFVRLVAITCRRLGKLIAAANAIWIVVACTLQLSGFFNQCYCNSNVPWLGGRAYNIISSSSSLLRLWICSLLLAWGSAGLFVGFVNLFTKSKPTRFP